MITHPPSPVDRITDTPHRPLALKRLCGDEADFINAIRHAADTDLSCIEPGTVLQWRPCAPGDEGGSAAARQATVALQGDSGELLLEDGGAFIQALTGIPLHAQVEPAQKQWLRSTAAALLPPPLRAVFSAIAQPVGEARPAGGAPRLKARLVLRTADHVLATHGSAPWTVWRRLLAPAASRLDFDALPSAWSGVRLNHPVLVGMHWLGAQRLRSLSVGDIVLPRQPIFDASGRGSLNLGPVRVDVQSGAGQALEVVAVYSSADRQQANNGWDGRDSPDDGFQGGQEDGPWDPEGAAHAGGDDAEAPTGAYGMEPLSALQVPLQFELGTVSLSLGEMQGLAPGSVLRLQSPASPPHVVVRAGGKVVGQGELIDVDGRLGIQLTAWAEP